MPYYFFFLFVSVAKTSNMILNRNGNSEHPCLAPDFSESFSALSVMLAAGLL